MNVTMIPLWRVCYSYPMSDTKTLRYVWDTHAPDKETAELRCIEDKSEVIHINYAYKL